MNPKPKVVALGGGTGLATLLRGLKNFPISLSAVVTMTDNGQSSGRLSRELGVQPPGDIRKSLAALANNEQLLTKLFEYRFNKGHGLSGHSLGNLLLIALADITGDFESAVQASSKILSIKGEVLPSTLEHASLVAELVNGQQALGEVEIRNAGHRFGIKKISLLPPNASGNPIALRFIEDADLIILGPGSLYTSVIPNLLIKDIRHSIEQSKAIKIYICNASTERGETEHFSVEDHLKTLQKYLGKINLNAMFVNSQILLAQAEGKLGNIHNITSEQEMAHGVPIIRADLIDEAYPLYHDVKKLANCIWQYFVTVNRITISNQ